MNMNHKHIAWIRDTRRIAKQFIEQIVARRVTDEDMGWRISGDYAIFIDQPYVCAKCEEVIQNDHTYIVNTKFRQVHAFFVDNFRTRCDHPHVSGNGNICLGDLDRDVDATAEALFLNHNPDNTYTNYVEWLKNIGHDCPNAHIRKVVCEQCDGEWDNEDEDWYGWSDALNMSVCNNCWDDLIVTCQKCEEPFHRDSDELLYIESLEQDYCRACAERYLAYCTYCDQHVPSREIDGYVQGVGDICNVCREAEPNLVACDDCEDFVKDANSYVGEGGATYCSACILRHPAEEPEQEEVSDANTIVSSSI